MATTPGEELRGFVVAMVLAAVLLPAFDPYTGLNLTLLAGVLIALLAIGAVMLVVGAVAQTLEGL